MQTNTNSHSYAVIMAGGRGERFWPLSTSRHPKQVLSLLGRKPLLAMAVDYLRGLIPSENVFVITSADLVGVTRRAVPQVPGLNVVGEPVGRDTAAVCALGAALVGARDPAGVFCVLTADHVIRDAGTFRRTLSAGIRMARSSENLVTIGMQPTRPHTGFGYIEVGTPLRGGGTVRFYKAKRFVEKPDLKMARHYVASGRFLWNGGMFIWSVPSLMKALRIHAPGLADMAGRLTPWAGRSGFARRLAGEYAQLSRISIDYALMEKADNIVVARGQFRWDDVGSWTALENHLKADKEGNVVLGVCESVDSRGNIVVSRNGLTALVGVSNLIVVQANGVTMVCSKDRAQNVKQLVQQLARAGRYERWL